MLDLDYIKSLDSCNREGVSPCDFIPAICDELEQAREALRNILAVARTGLIPDLYGGGQRGELAFRRSQLLSIALEAGRIVGKL